MMFSMVAIVNTMDLESIFSKHTPPLLNDSSLVFLTTARIYAELHNVSKHQIKPTLDDHQGITDATQLEFSSD